MYWIKIRLILQNILLCMAIYAERVRMNICPIWPKHSWNRNRAHKWCLVVSNSKEKSLIERRIFYLINLNGLVWRRPERSRKLNFFFSFHFQLNQVLVRPTRLVRLITFFTKNFILVYIKVISLFKKNILF